MVSMGQAGVLKPSLPHCLMDCSQVAELAPLYLSGELDRERAGAVDAHLRFCASCMSEIESQARLDARMREVIAGEHVDASAVERWIRARISTEPRNKVASISPPRPQPRSRRKWIAVAIGIAAVLLLAALGYRGLLSSARCASLRRRCEGPSARSRRAGAPFLALGSRRDFGPGSGAGNCSRGAVRAFLGSVSPRARQTLLPRRPHFPPCGLHRRRARILGLFPRPRLGASARQPARNRQRPNSAYVHPWH